MPQLWREAPVLSTIGLWSKSGRHRETHCPFSDTLFRESSLRNSSSLSTAEPQNVLPSPACCGDVGFLPFTPSLAPEEVWLPYSLRGRFRANALQTFSGQHAESGDTLTRDAVLKAKNDFPLEELPLTAAFVEKQKAGSVIA